MDITMMTELMKVYNQNNKKEIFAELSDQIFMNDTHSDLFNSTEVKISSLQNSKIAEELKTLNVIELDSIESFLQYINYDYFLMFKFNDDYYYCETALVPTFGNCSLIKLIDFKQYLRKDKIKKLNQE